MNDIHDTIDEIEDKSCEFASKVFAEKRDDAKIVLGACEYDGVGVIPHVWNEENGTTVDVTAEYNTLSDSPIVVDGEHPKAEKIAVFDDYENFRNSDEWRKNAQELAEEAM